MCLGHLEFSFKTKHYIWRNSSKKEKLIFRVGLLEKSIHSAVTETRK